MPNILGTMYLVILVGFGAASPLDGRDVIHGTYVRQRVSLGVEVRARIDIESTQLSHR